MLRDVIITIMGIILVALITGKAVVSALTHITAWVMTKLAERGTFSMSKFDYMEFYESHAGDIDIEH